MADIANVDCTEENAPMACYGTSAFVRLSFALLIFHILMLLVTMVRTETAADIHDGCWCFKIILILGLFLSAFWIPDEPFFTSFYL